jgi:hypothetical protein
VGIYIKDINPNTGSISNTMSSAPKFPVFGILEPQNEKDEKILQFHHETSSLQIWHKEKVEKTISYSTIIAAVVDVFDKKYFTIYFNDGGLPRSLWCPTQEHCVQICGYLGQCSEQEKPNLCEGDTDQLYSSTWVEKKGKVKWAKRWIALVGNRLLCYRNEGIAPKGRKAPSTVPLNVIPISGNVACTKFTLGPSGTIIILKTFREYQFKFSSKQEATAWLQALHQAATRQDNISAGTASLLSTVATESKTLDMSPQRGGNNGHKRGRRKKRNSIVPDVPKDTAGRILPISANTLRLYTWGSNKKGQLASAVATSQMSPLPQQVESLRGKNTPKGVACGYAHMACITTTGQLFVWGEGKHGQLGLGSHIKQSSRPYLVSSLSRTPIKMVACGRLHTLVVTESGSVMSWGSGERGALGLGDAIKKADTPQALSNVGRAYGQPVIGVSCSTEHSAILTSTGR